MEHTEKLHKLIKKCISEGLECDESVAEQIEKGINQEKGIERFIVPYFIALILSKFYKDYEIIRIGEGQLTYCCKNIIDLIIEHIIKDQTDRRFKLDLFEFKIIQDQFADLFFGTTKLICNQRENYESAIKKVLKEYINDNPFNIYDTREGWYSGLCSDFYECIQVLEEFFKSNDKDKNKNYTTVCIYLVGLYIGKYTKDRKLLKKAITKLFKTLYNEALRDKIFLNKSKQPIKLKIDEVKCKNTKKPVTLITIGAEIGLKEKVTHA